MTQRELIAESEKLAKDTRERLGLDNAPVNDIFSLLEGQGIFVVRMPIEANELSGAFYYDKKTKRASILINDNRSKGHQLFTAAHEFCHYLIDKEENPIIIEDFRGVKPEFEKRADMFAAMFLMPEEGVLHFVRGILKNDGARLNDTEIAKIRNEYGLSWSATLFRLHSLRYLFNKTVAEKIKDTRLLNFQAAMLGFEEELSCAVGKLKLPSEYRRLAFSAFFEEKISLEKLAELLRISSEEAIDELNKIKKVRDERCPE